MDFLTVLFLLMGSHFICDYPLQSDFIAQGKNRNTKLGRSYWTVVLPAHGMTHAMGVMLITQSLGLALFQLVTHVIIDFIKCDNKISFHLDQYLHFSVMFITAVLYTIFM